MNRPNLSSTLWMRIMQRLGGWYLLVVVVVAQIFSAIGTLITAFSIQINAEFTRDEISQIAGLVIGAVIIGNLLLLAGVYFLYPDLRHRLTKWSINEEVDNNEEQDALVWRQITAFAWSYGAASIAVRIITNIIPIIIFQILVLHVTQDQLIHSFLGAIAALLGSTVLAILIVDHLLVPAREVLLPLTEEAHLTGTINNKVLTKLLFIVLALIVASVLMIAPIGYHQTATALVTGKASVLRTLQVQSLLATAFILILGTGMALLLAQSVSSPLRQLIDTFSKVEAGDLSQRAKIIATDEVGALAVHFNRMVSRLDELQGSLEDQIAQQTEQLRATADVGRAISSILDPDELILAVVNLITERLGYYYAAIFFVSTDGRWAELKDATGTAGQSLKQRNHRLPIGGQNMVGAAINGREARIALDVGLEAVRFENPLLPETRSEIALPLIAGGHVLGALDVQSVDTNAFSENVLETLQGMANQVAIALENAHLFQETQQALQEIRAAQQQQLQEAWTGALSVGNFEYATGNELPTGKEQEIVPALNVPLALRDQIIGEIILEGDEDWSTEDRIWVEAVATQAALALENARLLEESQQLALQERLIAEISGKIWSSATIDNILQTAVQELGLTLGASKAVIELHVDDKA